MIADSIVVIAVPVVAVMVGAALLLSLPLPLPLPLPLLLLLLLQSPKPLSTGAAFAHGAVAAPGTMLRGQREKNKECVMRHECSQE